MKDKVSLHFYNAIKKGQLDRVKNYVLNEGVNPNIQFQDGSSPLHTAVAQQELEILKFLLSLKALPDVKDRSGQTPLMLGIANEDIVQILLNYGANVEITDRWKRTALHLATGKGLYRVTQLLLDANASVNVTDQSKRTALHLTVANAASGKEDLYVDITTLLIQKGAHVNRGDKYGDTPLVLAVKSGVVILVETLISYGADVNRPGRRRTPPILLAVLDGRSAMVEILVKHNCIIGVCNPINNKSCLYIAMEKGYLDIAQLLVIAGVQLHKENLPAIQSLPSLTTEAATWWRSVTLEPFSLKHLCRSHIRRTMGQGIHAKLHRVTIPDVLRNYVLLHGKGGFMSDRL